MKKFKKILTMFCVFATALAINVVPASAANTKDKTYGYDAITGVNWQTTDQNTKENTSKVYVKPKQSPTGYTMVQTWCKQGGANKNQTAAGTVTLTSGKAYGITNYVYEKGDKSGSSVIMWLKYKPSKLCNGAVSGVWSPDWSGKTSVTIV